MQGNAHGSEAASVGDSGQPLNGQEEQAGRDDRAYRPLPSFDFAAWLGPEEAAEPPAQPGKRGRRGLPAPATQGGDGGGARKPETDRTRRIKRAAAYIERFSIAISGDHGHDQTFDVACALIKGFDLTIDEATPIFDLYCDQCDPPWSAAERHHKLDDANKKTDDKPRGYLYDAERPQKNGQAIAGIPELPPGMDLDTTEGMEEDPHRLARLLIQEYNHPLGRTIHYWNEEFWVWRDARYVVVPKEEIKAEVTCIVGDEFLNIHSIELAKYRSKKSERGKMPKLRAASTRLIGDVIQALKSLVILFTEDIPSQPAWINAPQDAMGWNIRDIMPVKNALVHLPSYAANLPSSINSTPQFFNSYSLSYDVESLEGVGEPVEWLKFLNQLWPDSPESIKLLQEWFGYMLTHDTSHHKILMLIGPRRSGKGTIVRMLTQIVGVANVANPTLGSLTTPFGLHPLFGKSLAIITDARLSKRHDKPLIVERLLSISGEDMQTIDRKYLDSITVKLPTRFTIVSNEIPNLNDPSGAFTGRIICLELIRSFFGEEDHSLFDKLMMEKSQIFAWSVVGWKRLQKNGRFVQPDDTQALVEEMEGVVSRIRTFVRELCDFTSSNGECSVPVDELYARWKLWNMEREYKPSSRDGFGQQLRSAFRFIKRVRFRDGQNRLYKYVGVRLKDPWEIDSEFDLKATQEVMDVNGWHEER